VCVLFTFSTKIIFLEVGLIRIACICYVFVWCLKLTYNCFNFTQLNAKNVNLYSFKSADYNFDGILHINVVPEEYSSVKK
jgi:hypothetical protein